MNLCYTVMQTWQAGSPDESANARVLPVHRASHSLTISSSSFMIFPCLIKYTSKVIFMAFVDEVAVGYLRAYIHDFKLRVGCLDELYIKEEARGQAIGKKLLDAGAQWMKEKSMVRTP